MKTKLYVKIRNQCRSLYCVTMLYQVIRIYIVSWPRNMAALPSVSLYMGDSYFESRPLYSLWFSVVFLSPSKHIPLHHLKLSHHLLQFMNYCHKIVV